MNKDHYPVYGVVLVAGAAIAIFAGMPSVFLLFLACPLMMFFMMKGMSGMQNDTPSPPAAENATPSVTPPLEGMGRL